MSQNEDIEYLSNIPAEQWAVIKHKHHIEFSARSGYFDPLLKAANLKDVKRILDDEEVFFWLADGTVLGFYREKNFIRWDSEIDIDTFEEYLLPKIYRLRKRFIDKGFIVRFSSLKNRAKLNLFRHKTKTSIRGLYSNRAYENNRFRLSSSYRYPKYFFKRFDKIAYKRESYNVPSPLHDYILYVYGKYWKKPIKIKKKKTYGAWLAKGVRISRKDRDFLKLNWERNTMHRNRIFLEHDKKKIIRKPSFYDLKKEYAITRLCGTHDALSSMLIEEANFEGLWISSFEAHASCRLPDADILTVSDYCNICNKIADRTNLPILVDGDTGGGSPINTIRMVREYEKNGASGLCIEDNRYPKRCSFYEGVKRKLEDPQYHASKIRAACDNRLSNDFFIVARTEALIVGLTVEEALDRANTYVDAGADAILIHHKGETPDKIFEFSNRFDHKVPLVCVPTTYNQVTEKELIDNGFSYVIYANYGIRSCVKVMQKVFRTIAENNTLSAANADVVPMSDIFRLVGLEDLNFNEKKYQ